MVCSERFIAFALLSPGFAAWNALKRALRRAFDSMDVASGQNCARMACNSKRS